MVQPVPEFYISSNEVGQKLARKQVGDQLVTLILTGSTVGIFALFGWQQKKLNALKME